VAPRVWIGVGRDHSRGGDPADQVEDRLGGWSETDPLQSGSVSTVWQEAFHVFLERDLMA
jgi:hypothetical protein